MNGQVTGEATLAELEAVLASAAFSRSPRLASLLSYLCNKCFKGQAGEIKEYNIAVDVLDRPGSFDPNEDAIARVEVHRLRKKLREYYLSEGAGHAIRIEIPPGSYVPNFVTEPPAAPPNGVRVDEKAAPSNGTVTSDTVTDPSLLKRLLPYWKLAVAAVLVAIVVILWRPLSPVMGKSRDRAVVPAAVPATHANFSLGPVPDDAVRILCGRRQPFADTGGRVWGPDNYFDGGSYLDTPKALLTRTADPRLYDGARVGAFSYDIPLKPGIYELHLYFAETAFGPGMPAGGGENSRVFHVSLNGKRILSDFDIVSDAGGPAVADEHVFKDVSPGNDGQIHLRFMSQRSQALINAIRITPSTLHHMNPIRIVCQDKAYTDSNHVTWLPDDYFSGGQSGAAGADVATRDPAIYFRERYGNFSYAIPAGEGLYAVTMHFAEKFWGLENAGGGGAGDRVFDVFCNGFALIRNLDVYKEAGANHALVKTIHGLKANAQGKLMISFMPVKNYASLYALEVVDETP